MKKLLSILSLLAIMLVTSGCLDEVAVPKIIGQKITVQKRMGEENNFEDFKEITQKKKVEKAIHIIKNADWLNAKVERGRYANYQFQFPIKSSNESKISSYLLWVTPNGENLEIVTDSHKYVKLTKQDSASLYEILTGEELKK